MSAWGAAPGAIKDCAVGPGPDVSIGGVTDCAQEVRGRGGSRRCGQDDRGLCPRTLRSARLRTLPKMCRLEPLPRSVLRPPGYTPRRGAGLSGYERVLARAGLAPVAGIDEAGRGACAGPLVVAAVVFPAADPPVARLADSKALTPAVREQVYREVVAHALSWHTVVIPAAEIDRLGLHVCNIAGMRRALAGISCRPGYVLTDGFPVSGLTVPALAMWKGDQVAACVAAASVVAKVTRDRIMTSMLHDRYPVYDFAEHKGYATRRHTRGARQARSLPGAPVQLS